MEGQEKGVQRAIRKILGAMTAQVFLVSQFIKVYTYAQPMNKAAEK